MQLRFSCFWVGFRCFRKAIFLRVKICLNPFFCIKFLFLIHVSVQDKEADACFSAVYISGVHFSMGIGAKFTVQSYEVCVRVWNRFFLCACSDFSPSPLYDAKITFCRTAGEGVRRLQSSRKNSKRKQHFVLFFLLPYGVTAENQPFKNTPSNCLLIVM